jgi:uncharacterized protein (DUF924 family)
MNCYRLVTVFNHAIVDCRVCRHLSTDVEHPDRPVSKVLSIPNDGVGYDPLWSPTWQQMMDLVDRYAITKTSALEEEWLKDHPIEWMNAVQAKMERVKLHIQQSRAQLKDTPHVIEVDGASRTNMKYVSLKGDTEKRNARRQAFLLRLDEQKKEAKRCFGYDPVVSRAEIADALLRVKSALRDDDGDEDRPNLERAHAILDAVIYWLREGHR